MNVSQPVYSVTDSLDNDIDIDPQQSNLGKRLRDSSAAVHNSQPFTGSRGDIRRTVLELLYFLPGWQISLMSHPAAPILRLSKRVPNLGGPVECTSTKNPLH